MHTFIQVIFYLKRLPMSSAQKYYWRNVVIINTDRHRKRIKKDTFKA